MQVNRFPLSDEPKRASGKSIVKRREFLGLTAGLALSPCIGRAQQSPPLIGFLHCGSIAYAGPQVSAFLQGLNQAEFPENHNITMTYRWGDDHYERLPALARDLLNQGVSIIVAGGTPAAAAATQATRKIPIIFVAASNSAGTGFILDRAEGNTTGVSLAAPELLAERFQTLLKLVPALRSVAVLVNPQTSNIDVQLQYLNDEAKRRGVHATVINASGETEFTAALDQIVQRRQEALVLGNDGFLNGGRDRLIALATTKRIPAAFVNRQFVEAGGLMSYGPSLLEAYRQAGTLAERILKGERPVDLPVRNPLQMELALNVQAARSLNLEIPPALLAAAGEVIK